MRFVAYWYFMGWANISVGLSINIALPNIEIHMPFGFIRIGWVEGPVYIGEDWRIAGYDGRWLFLESDDRD